VAARTKTGADALSTVVHLENNDKVFDSPDSRVAQMMKILLRESLGEKSSSQRVRLLIASWVLRNKITESTKRIFDLLIALMMFPVMLPILVFTALAIKLDSRGPVIYRQERVGKWGRTFACYKFRSMFVDADAQKSELMALNEADEIVFKMRKDPRVTRVGRIIRKLSIDELPQLFNVIKGDMSIVGPRPPVPYEVSQYQYEHFGRLDTVPGITGLQQVSGRSTVSFKRWIELDLQYIQEQSLLKDIEIILRTIPAVISGKGAY
jgi:exopolysaccharide biosynthesis polyprenyl glycosylphosphotransferase